MDQLSLQDCLDHRTPARAAATHGAPFQAPAKALLFLVDDLQQVGQHLGPRMLAMWGLPPSASSINCLRRRRPPCPPATILLSRPRTDFPPRGVGTESGRRSDRLPRRSTVASSALMDPLRGRSIRCTERPMIEGAACAPTSPVRLHPCRSGAAAPAAMASFGAGVRDSTDPPGGHRASALGS